jgi:hypothetical protein
MGGDVVGLSQKGSCVVGRCQLAFEAREGVWSGDVAMWRVN